MQAYLRVFGSGPLGVASTAVLLLAFQRVDATLPPVSLGLPSSARYLALALACLGTIAGIIWSFRSLPVAARGRRLCVQGAYGWVRHPLYASFISIGAPGLVLFVNHWSGLLLLVVLHLVWHGVIVIEERHMIAQFGDEYLAYAKRTGRFVPRLRRR